MNAFVVELIKLRRSQAWVVVVALPVLIAAVGTFNTLGSGAELENGWDTLWLRTVVFYGLFPLPLGIAVLASLVWRGEHRGGNWNALMSGALPASRIVVAKAGTVALLTAGMQSVMLVTVVVIGKTVFDLPGMLPARYLVIGVLIMVASAPVAAVQSWMSMSLRSFAAPIAVALVGAGGAVVLLTAKVHAAVFVLPYALAARATQLASGSFGDSGTLTPGTVITALVATVLLSAVTLAVGVVSLERREVHS
ncbi:hypothetical protein GCM10027289_12490 [Tsukamurella serpentis]